MTANRGIVNGLPTTGVAPLAGGVAGQVLTKRSDDNFDMGWTTNRWQFDFSTFDGAVAGLPNFAPFAQSTAAMGGSQRPMACFFMVDRPIVISQALLIVNAAGAANTLIRFGIYRVPTPRIGNIGNGGSVTNLELVSDFGTVSAASTGTRTVTLSSPLTLGAGLYLSYTATDAASLTLAAMTGISNIFLMRGLNVTNAWRTFGLFWGETSGGGTLVNGLSPTTSVSTGSNIGSSGSAVNIQFVFYNWANA